MAQISSRKLFSKSILTKSGWWLLYTTLNPTTNVWHLVQRLSGCESVSDKKFVKNSVLIKSDEMKVGGVRGRKEGSVVLCLRLLLPSSQCQCPEIALGEAGPVCLFKTSDDSLRALMSSDFLCSDWLFLPDGGPRLAETVTALSRGGHRGPAVATREFNQQGGGREVWMQRERELSSQLCHSGGQPVCSGVENNFISPVATRSATQHTLDTALRDLPASQPQ